MNRRLVTVIVVSLVVLGLFLRLYHRDQAMYYQNDQGLLLITTYDVLFGGHRPQVGPQISLPGVVIPPYMYYLVGAFMQLGNDPLVISLGYIVLNMVAGLFLFYYGALVCDMVTGFITLGIVMVSAAMVENGRSIWQAHPTFFFVTLYLWLTEVAYRKKNIWLYSLGLVVYAVSIATYPTPLLLLFFVIWRTSVQMPLFGGKRKNFPLSIVFVCGLLVAVFLPWIHQQQAAFQSSMMAARQVVHVVSPVRFFAVFYANASVVVHDIFALSAMIPSSLAGQPGVKAFVGLLGVLIVASLRKGQRKEFIRLFTNHGYHLLLLGLLGPAIFGITMPAHRLIPFYPFLFLGLAWWIRTWIISKHLIQKWFMLLLIIVAIVGNGISWYTSTIAAPRREYRQAKREEEVIIADISRRNIVAPQFGVHYVTPIDSFDYYGQPLFYLLRLSTGYTIPYTALGNDIDRGIAETRALVYLVCAGFDKESEISDCLDPLLKRWQVYREVDTYSVSGSETVFVLARQ